MLSVCSFSAILSSDSSSGSGNFISLTSLPSRIAFIIASSNSSSSLGGSDFSETPSALISSLCKGVFSSAFSAIFSFVSGFFSTVLLEVSAVF